MDHAADISVWNITTRVGLQTHNFTRRFSFWRVEPSPHAVMVDALATFAVAVVALVEVAKVLALFVGVAPSQVVVVPWAVVVTAVIVAYLLAGLLSFGVVESCSEAVVLDRLASLAKAVISLVKVAKVCAILVA